MVRVINSTPDASVVKQKVCRNCGVTLEYTPKSVKLVCGTTRLPNQFVVIGN